MRDVVLKMSLSADGFVGGPNGEIDWLFRSLDADATAWLVETLSSAGVHIMGSRTFRDMAAYWPYSTDPLAAPMNSIPKAVFTRGSFAESSTTAALTDARKVNPATADANEAHEASWRQPAIASGELSEEIATLKRQPGRFILAHGGATFAQSLVGANLVDEFRLLIHPVALGAGLALFSSLTQPLHLTLVQTTAFSSGTVAHVYRRA
jgi:dihydrofolate reductase